MSYYVECDVCNRSLSADDYQSHLQTQKHKLQEKIITDKKNLEDTGLFIQDVPPGVSAADLQMLFGRFGTVSKVEIYGPKAYLNFVEKSSCEEAIKHRHVIHNRALHVKRRKIFQTQPCSSLDEKPYKRRFDYNQKNSPQTSTQDPRARAHPKVKIDNTTILKALTGPAPISEQMKILQNLILAQKVHCGNVVQSICDDLLLTLQTAFSVCELLPFGSMTTGLAFKDSDIDVFAHLEFNMSTHILPKDQTNFNKLFGKAKSCLYSRSGLFSNIVPIQRAKTPIIKFLHRRTEVSCDLSFKDAIGYCNSRLLRHYLSMNEKFFEVILFLKYWARVHGLCSTNKLSNFSLCMLGLSFFFSLKDQDGHKIVPPVQELLNGADPSNPHYIINGWRCGFNETPVSISLPDSLEFSLLGLLKNFFGYISNLPFETHVISLLTGELINRKAFGGNCGDLPAVYEPYLNYITKNPSDVLFKAKSCAVIHDPFKLNHNLLSRINNATLHEFILTCRASKEVCVAAVNNNNVQMELFHHLLDTKYLGVETSVKNKEVIKPVEIVICSPDIARDSSIKYVMDVVICIFEKLMLLKTSESDNVDSDSIKAKVHKAEDKGDVHETRPCNVICCEGNVNVWAGRKKARKVLNQQGIMTKSCFEIEQSISQYLSGQHVAKTFMKFKCEVSCIDGKLYLKVSDMVFDKSVNPNTFASTIHSLFIKWIPIVVAMRCAQVSQSGSSAEGSLTQPSTSRDPTTFPQC